MSVRSTIRIRQFLKPRIVSREVETLIDRLPMGNIGSFGYDPWGLNPDTAKITFMAVQWLYQHYFRVVANGLENVAGTGRLLIVGNHSGQLPMDGVLVSFAVANKGVDARLPRSMIERWFGSVPFLGNWMNSVGGVIGDPRNCAKMTPSTM